MESEDRAQLNSLRIHWNRLTISRYPREHTNMGWNDHIDPELTELIDELIASGYVFPGGLPFVVARKIQGEGLASLDEIEHRTFEDEIMPALRALQEAKVEREAADNTGAP